VVHRSATGRGVTRLLQLLKQRHLRGGRVHTSAEGLSRHLHVVFHPTASNSRLPRSREGIVAIGQPRARARVGPGGMWQRTPPILPCPLCGSGGLPGRGRAHRDVHQRCHSISCRPIGLGAMCCRPQSRLPLGRRAHQQSSIIPCILPSNHPRHGAHPRLSVRRDARPPDTTRWPSGANGGRGWPRTRVGPGARDGCGATLLPAASLALEAPRSLFRRPRRRLLSVLFPSVSLPTSPPLRWGHWGFQRGRVRHRR